MIPLNENPLLTFRGYDAWFKAVLRSGEATVSKAARTALLVVSYGRLGHGAWPSTETLVAASGESERTISRHLSLLRKRGLLIGQRRFNNTTLWCSAVMVNGVPLPPTAEKRCPLCWPDDAGGLNTLPESVVQAAMGGSAIPPLTAAYQEWSTTSDQQGSSGADPAPLSVEHERRVVEVLALAQALRSDWPAQTLQLIEREMRVNIVRAPAADFCRTVRELARRQRLSEKQVVTFFGNENPSKIKTRQSRAEVMGGQVRQQELAQALLATIVEWERAHADDHTPGWLQLASSPWALADPHAVMAQWRGEGRGGPEGGGGPVPALQLPDWDTEVDGQGSPVGDDGHAEDSAGDDRRDDDDDDEGDDGAAAAVERLDGDSSRWSTRVGDPCEWDLSLACEYEQAYEP